MPIRVRFRRGEDITAVSAPSAKIRNGGARLSSQSREMSRASETDIVVPLGSLDIFVELHIELSVYPVYVKIPTRPREAQVTLKVSAEINAFQP